MKVIDVIDKINKIKTIKKCLCNEFLEDRDSNISTAQKDVIDCAMSYLDEFIRILEDKEVY